METRRDSGHLLWGIVLVALGLLFLSSNFGCGTWVAWGRWWPVVLIVIGVVLLYRRRTEAAGGAPAPPGRRFVGARASCCWGTSATAASPGICCGGCGPAS